METDYPFVGRHSLQITGDDLIGRILSEAMLKGSTLRRERVFIGWTIRLRKELPPIDFRVEVGETGVTP